jgi:hypothetical protein
MAQMYATYKDNYNNLNQVALTTTADNDMIYNVMDIGGQFGYYAWFDSVVKNKVVIERFDLTNGTRTTIEAGETITGAKNPIMLCLTRDGNTLYMTCAGQSTIYKYTSITTSPTQATSITSVSGAIYAMKINKSGHLTTLSAGNIINQFNTASNDVVVGTANKDWTSTFSTYNIGSFYENIPLYFSYEAGTESIILPLWRTSTKKWQIMRLAQSSFNYGTFATFYPNSYRPYSTTNPHKYGADLLFDVYGDCWLSHTSYNQVASLMATYTGAVSFAEVKRISNPISVIYLSWTTTASITTFVIKETDTNGATITTIAKENVATDVNFTLADNELEIYIGVSSLASNGTITIPGLSTAEVLKIQPASKSDFERPLTTKNYRFIPRSSKIININNYAYADFNVNGTTYISIAYWEYGTNLYRFKIKNGNGDLIFEQDPYLSSPEELISISNNNITGAFYIGAPTSTETYTDCYFEVQTTDYTTGGNVLFSDQNYNTLDEDRDLNLINNLSSDSTGAVYYSYIENLASTEVNGKIYKYRSDGGADEVVPSNVETFLSRTYSLTNRNDMTAYDLSTDGCAGR